MDEVLTWAARADFTGSAETFERQWHSSTSEELASIAHRTCPALRELDEDAIEEATRPAIEALTALPAEQHLRRATADIVVLVRT